MLLHLNSNAHITFKKKEKKKHEFNEHLYYCMMNCFKEKIAISSFFVAECFNYVIHDVTNITYLGNILSNIYSSTKQRDLRINIDMDY